MESKIEMEEQYLTLQTELNQTLKDAIATELKYAKLKQQYDTLKAELNTKQCELLREIGECNALTKELISLKAKPRPVWVKASERLPEPDQRVMVYNEGLFLVFLKFWPAGFKNNDEPCFIGLNDKGPYGLDEITHWAPLPPGPPADTLNPELLQVIRDAEKSKEEDLKAVKEVIGGAAVKIDREWVNNALVEFALAYHRTINKDIANDAAEYLNDKLNEAGVIYVLSEDESAAGREDWISVDERLPEESGRYWCYMKDINDLGASYFQWNCDYNPQLQRFSDMTLTKGERVTHWRKLPEPPKQQK